jgi:hypothetical protein
MIFAFGHEAGCGKDTFIMFCMDELRARFKGLELIREGFADRLYDLCFNLYSWAGFQQRQFYITNPKAKEEVLPALGKTPRQLLIGIAEKVREFDPCAWLNPVFRNKPRHLKFISDLRTPEEVEVGRSLGAYLVKIERPGCPKVQCAVSALLRDRTDCWDEVILNDGNLSQFRDKALEFNERKLVPIIQSVLLAKK